MASTHSPAFSRRLASTLALSALAAVAVRTDGHYRAAQACGWDGPSIVELTTFDPAVVAEPGGVGLDYDPFTAGFGGPCFDCAQIAMATDWAGYFGGAIAAADWEPVLLRASVNELVALKTAVAAGKVVAGDYAAITRVASATPALRTQLARALEYVALARKVETITSVQVVAQPSTINAMLAAAEAGVVSAKKANDPFLTQRYAFVRLRTTFYGVGGDYVVEYFDANAALLAGPSPDLAGRARYYAAGALRRQGNLSRANLELARVHATAPGLAGVAAQDFQPMEDRDWRATLGMAKDVREQTELWRLVGFKADGLAAAQEIAKLDPKSNLLALLAVRELGRIEATTLGLWTSPDATARAAAVKAGAALEKLAASIAGTAGADRPWLMQLVAGHLAARRGDVATARTRLTAAVAGRPGDAKVAAQARASLAIALAHDGGRNRSHAEELARTMTQLTPDFPRADAVVTAVRGSLADAAIKSGRLVDAEFLRPGDPAVGSKWQDARFIRKMIARAGVTKTAFDRFVVRTYAPAALEQELAMRLVLDGKYAEVAKRYAAKPPAADGLGTDPFVAHIVDCHDCDHATFSTAPWNRQLLVTRMAALAKKASGRGPAAAAAAFDLGTAHYNLTWYGNARVVLEDTHQATRDPATALRWYKRAHDLATDRELRARAAFFAAKAEQAALISKKYEPYEEAASMPVPTTWYPIVKTYADTTYYQEILRECGTYAAWARK